MKASTPPCPHPRRSGKCRLTIRAGFMRAPVEARPFRAANKAIFKLGLQARFGAEAEASVMSGAIRPG
jgi:hypothetical protein